MDTWLKFCKEKTMNFTEIETPPRDPKIEQMINTWRGSGAFKFWLPGGLEYKEERKTKKRKGGQS